MCSELRTITVVALFSVTLVLPAQAEDASTQGATDAHSAVEDVGGDAIDPNCSAEEKRRRRSDAARAKRMVREAIAATRTTVADAEVIASEYWEETDRLWFAEIRDRGRTRLQSWRTAVGSLPSTDLCRALATRDRAACRGLTSEDERGACERWHEVWRHGRSQGRCEDATPGIQGACRMVAAGAPWRCPPSKDGKLDLCGRAANVLQAAEATCDEPPDPHLCTWSLWMRTIRGGGDTCSLVEGKGAGPVRPGIAGRCRAVAEQKPALCTTEGAPTAAGRPAVVFHSDTALSQEAFVPRVLVSVQTDTPAVCAILTRLRDPRGEEAHRFLEVLALNSWAPVELRHPMPEHLKRAEGLSAQTSTVCAVRTVW